jgi:choline dehydrogenase-like flavoprotein
VAEAETLAAGSVGPNRIALFSAHVNGTCRMGTDPAHSGATPDGERHGVRGLYITDGSLLPTALGVNPQETIMSVATVLAGRMIDRHGGLARH